MRNRKTKLNIPEKTGRLAEQMGESDD